jgi:2-polyprenyl-6-methoxyphenol hydroxylase-like FAD-dependent oxidoreductase
VEETKDHVTFALADGTHVTSSVLIAADGIHSKIRGLVFPSIKPVYNDILVVCGAIKRSLLAPGENDELDCPVMYPGKNGAFVLAPQDADGSEFLAGTQRAFPAQDREGWDRIAKDMNFLHGFLRESFEDRQPIVQSAIEGIQDDSIYTWAFHTLPKLPRWSSEGGRIVIIGDAAHAIPPTTGQGANQALEDTYSFALLMTQKSTGTSVAEAIGFWQTMRQERIDGLLELTSKLNNLRLPVEEQKKLEAGEVFQVEDGGSGEQWRWLFQPELEKKIAAWVDQQKQ